MIRGTPEDWEGDLLQMIMPVFVAEAEERIEVARRCLVSLAGAEQATATPLLSDLIREIHGLKMSAGAVGLGTVRTLSDGLEMLFERVRGDGLRLPEGMMDLAEGVLRILASLVQGCIPHTDRVGGLVELVDEWAGLEAVGRSAWVAGS